MKSLTKKIIIALQSWQSICIWISAITTKKIMLSLIF